MFRKHRYWAILLILMVVVLFVPTSDAAEKPVKVFLDGSEINYDVPPQIMSGRTMVPLNKTIEAITGSEAKWDNNTKTVTFSAGGHTNKLTIGDTVVYVDDKPYEFDTPSRIVNSRTLVPVRMIAETSGYNVDWDKDNYFVIITKKQDNKEGIYLEYDVMNVTGAELEGVPDSPNHIGYYWRAHIFGLGSEKFETYVSEYLEDAATKPVREFEKGYNDFCAVIADEKDPEIKKNLQEIAGRYSYESQTHIVTTAKNYCAVAEARYEYTGGAHPMTYIKMFNIDISGEKFIKLGDIFKDSSYKAIIDKKLAEMAKADKYKDMLFPDVEVKIYDEENFYIADGKIVIFYQLYDIAPYAAGFISFDIPLSELSDILKDEYRDATYKDNLTKEKVFSNIFQK